MRFLSDAEWLFLNELVLRVNSIVDDQEFRRRILMDLRVLIPYDDAAFFLTDRSKTIDGPEVWKSSGHFLDYVGIDVPERLLLDYATHWYAEDPLNNRIVSGESGVYRESDFLTPEDRTSPYYVEQLRTGNNLTCVFFHEGKNLGFIELNRERESGDFDDREVQVMQVVEPHITNRLAMWRVRSSCTSGEALFSKRFGISSREGDVVRCVISGASNVEIADELCVGISTVKKHLESVFRKTGVHSRFELMALVQQYR